MRFLPVSRQHLCPFEISASAGFPRFRGAGLKRWRCIWPGLFAVNTPIRQNRHFRAMPKSPDGSPSLTAFVPRPPGLSHAPRSQSQSVDAQPGKRARRHLRAPRLPRPARPHLNGAEIGGLQGGAAPSRRALGAPAANRTPRTLSAACWAMDSRWCGHPRVQGQASNTAPPRPEKA
jgi:hypothetical protein